MDPFYKRVLFELNAFATWQWMRTWVTELIKRKLIRVMPVEWLQPG
jgi:hypothetical protein